jgi:hypothetical protein
LNLPSSATATWLTEAGAHTDALHVPQSANETGQSDRMKFLVNTEARLNIMSAPPIKRLYCYGMWEQNSNGAQNFDTGLLKLGTRPWRRRPAHGVQRLLEPHARPPEGMSVGRGV